MSYEYKQIINTCSTKFLGLFIDSSLSWNNHIDQLMSKLGTAYYIIRSFQPSISRNKQRWFIFLMFIPFWLMV